MKFCEKIIKLRKQHGLSQEEFGGKINVSRQTISKWEAEQSQPDYESLKEISEVFNVSLDYLLNDTVDNEKQICRKPLDKKKIVKITIFVIIGLIALYLAYSAYKFVLLFGHHSEVNAIPDYESYSEKIVTKSSDENLGFGEMERISYLCSNENIYFFVTYDNLKMDLGQRVIGQVVFINKNTNQYYSLIYDENLQKFVDDGMFNDKTREEIDKILIEHCYILDKASIRNNVKYAIAFDESNSYENCCTPIKDLLIAAFDLKTKVTKDYIVQRYNEYGYKKIDFKNRNVKRWTSSSQATTIYEYEFSIDETMFNEIKSIEDLATYFGIPM